MLLVGWLGLGVTIAPQTLLDRPALLAAAIVIVMGAASYAARLLAPRREWLLIAGAALLPLRVPVPLGGQTYNLLLPLYGVILIAGLIQLQRDHARAIAPVAGDASEPARNSSDEPAHAAAAKHVGPLRPPALSWSSRGPALACDMPLALLVAWASLSIGWAIDLQAGAQKVALFILPFAVLYSVVRAWLDDGLELARPAKAFLVVMVAAALVGIFQHATGPRLAERQG